VKVVLTGEGSDELFGGYGRYRFYLLNERLLRWHKMLPSGVRKQIRGAITHSPLLSGNIRRKLGHTFLGRDESFESLYLDNFYSAFSAASRRRC
jgi:asparagine synthase (glutamine-hydrolysing)